MISGNYKAKKKKRKKSKEKIEIEPIAESAVVQVCGSEVVTAVALELLFMVVCL